MCSIPSKTKADSIDDKILAIHGFKITSNNNDSLQGCIYNGETIRKNQRKTTVIIKKTLKSLHNKRITSADNGLNIIVDEKCC